MDPFKDRNRGLASIHPDEQPIILKAKILMAEYMYFKHPFPDAIEILWWVREAWRESEEDLEIHAITSPASCKYVYYYLPGSETVNAS
jgi:hypothetical protein